MKATILIVDDEPHLRGFLSELLEAEGYRVMTAFDGQDALDLIARAGVPDLVMTDVLMPRLNGADLLAAARVLHPALPFVMMSAVARPIIPVDTPFVTKPFDIDRLLEVIAGALRPAPIIQPAALPTAPRPNIAAR